MAEISDFEVYSIHAQWGGTGLHVNASFPEDKTPVKQRLEPDADLGVHVFNQLLSEKHAWLADSKNPLKPASGGIIAFFEGPEGTYINFHQRDKGAGVHPGFHGIPSGFQNDPAHAMTEAGLRATAMREFLEEALIMTKDQKYALVPKGYHGQAKAHWKKIGIDPANFKSILEYEMEPFAQHDTYSVTENGQPVLTVKGHIAPLYESSRSLSWSESNMIKLPGSLSVEEIVAADIEGFFKGDTFIQFQRLNYIVPLNNLEGVGFAQPFEGDPSRYKIEEGRLVADPSDELVGPSKGRDSTTYVTEQLLAPDEQLTSVLGAHGVTPYKGTGRFEVLREVTRKFRDDELWVPAQYRASKE